MSGNAKQRRVFRRALARKGMSYVPPSDWRRIAIDRRVYLELPPILAYTHWPCPPGVAKAWATERGQR